MHVILIIFVGSTIGRCMTPLHEQVCLFGSTLPDIVDPKRHACAWSDQFREGAPPGVVPFI